MNGILCIESIWFHDISSQRETMAPLVEFIAKSNQVPHAYFTVGTVSELQLRLEKNRKAKFNTLYLCGHGNVGKFFLEQEEVTLERLAEMMDGRYEGWNVHFGSCLIMKTGLPQLRRFKRKIGASRVSGYTKSVDWVESSAWDLLWLSHLAGGLRGSSQYDGLLEKVGFRSI